MFTEPNLNLAKLGIMPGMRVADFGAGSGAYALAAARLLRAAGRVYAVEIQKGLLERLAAEAKQEGLTNLETIWGDVEKRGGAKLADESVDCVIISNLLFQSSAKYSVALEARRVLKPEGRVLVVEWQDSFAGLGLRPEAVVPPAEVKKIFAEANFSPAQEFVAGEHHYGLIFKKI